MERCHGAEGRRGINIAPAGKDFCNNLSPETTWPPLPGHQLALWPIGAVIDLPATIGFPIAA